MSDSAPRIEAAPESAAATEPGASSGLLPRLLAPMRKLRSWAVVHRTRGVAVAVVLLLLIAATIVVWTYLARMALRGGQVTLESTLKAFDAGDYDQARSLATHMLKGGYLERGEYGGPLFVLGAVACKDAELGSTPEQRRVDYLVASRYLDEANAYSFPAGREMAGQFLLGKSLLESNQFDDGIAVLDELLAAANKAADEINVREAHGLLAVTCLQMPHPRLEKALTHFEALLKSPLLNEDDRTDVLIEQADCLARLGRYDDARRTLNAVSDADNRPWALLTRAQFTCDELEATLQKTPSNEQAGLIATWGPQLTQIEGWLKAAAAIDPQSAAVTRRMNYLMGRSLELRGDTQTALRQFTRTRQLADESWEGLAAALAEADLLRRSGEFPAALIAYRRVLGMLNQPAAYRSVVLPLDRVRRRLLEALADFVDRQQFEDALALLVHFPPLFSPAEQLELRGETLQRWGDLILSQLPDTPWERSEARTAGLQHLREAGLAFEQLSELRFATSHYTGDLWMSAENYYRGHSFSRAIRMLVEYVRHEPELRNAQALLRLGQSHLALGQIPKSVDAFEECIEFHPRDSSAYQARIDCAKAYWYRGDVDRAENLLRDNIDGSELKPSSREWKDSLFELGMLLYEKGQHQETILTLGDAIDRYPQDLQNLLARYVIGESHRRLAEELKDRQANARATSERDRYKQLADEQLNTALDRFIEVQRTITLKADEHHRDPLMGVMQRNCYMLAGAVLFDLERYNEALNAFSNVSSLYPNDPFVLETFLQIANCWRRIGQTDKARGAIEQARLALERLPPGADFATATALGRDEWQLLLSDMSSW